MDETVYNFYGRGGSFDEQVSTDAPKAHAELLAEFWRTDVVYYDTSFGDVDGEWTYYNGADHILDVANNKG